MPNLAMRQPGSQFSGDGIELSWPIGGEREVLAVPDEDMTLRIRQRIAEGSISITDDKPTKSAETDAREYKLFTGEEARKRMAEPAGPVTRVVYRPSTPEDEKDFNPIVQTVVDPTTARAELAESERVAAEESAAVKAQEEAERAAAEARAAEAKAAKAAEEAKAAEAKVAEVPVVEPPAVRAERTQEAAATYLAQRDSAFKAPAPKVEAKASEPKTTTPAKKAPPVKKPSAPRATTKG